MFLAASSDMKKRVTASSPGPHARRWVVKRIAISLNRTTYDYVLSQQARLGSLSESELIRDLLREHQVLARQMEQLEEMNRRLRALEHRLQRRPRRRR